MSISQLLNNTYELNLFHQILPNDNEYLGIIDTQKIGVFMFLIN